jgi:hypothetical protein
MQIWLLWEIVGHITGCARRPWLQRFFMAITALAILGSLLISFYAPSPRLDYPVARLATAIDRTLWLAWCLLFTTLAASADLVGLKWRRQVMGITVGFVVQAIASTFYSWLLTAPNAPALDAMKNCAALLSLAIWAHALCEPLYLSPSPSARAIFETTLRQFGTTEEGMNNVR